MTVSIFSNHEQPDLDPWADLDEDHVHGVDLSIDLTDESYGAWSDRLSASQTDADPERAGLCPDGVCPWGRCTCVDLPF
jgi:hypothetical protein